MIKTKKERTQEEILEAAKYIVHANGHEAVTVRSLAKVTGYSYTNLYYYFKDLNSLLWILRLEIIEDMVEELTAKSFHKEDPIDEILEAFFSYTDYFFRNPNVFRFFYFYPFIQPEGDDSFQKLDKRFQTLWQDSFIRLTQEGIIDFKDIEIVAKTVIFSLQGMIMLSFSSNGEMNEDNIKNELSKLINYLLLRR